MTKISNFSTMYTTALPTDFLKVSKESIDGITKDKVITYANFLNQLYKGIVNDNIISEYSIDATTGNLILNNPNATQNPKLINNSSYLIEFKNIDYLWQDKPNINVELLGLDPIPLINGYFYDVTNQQNLDVNTIGNGIIKLTYDVNLKKFKLYKIGRASGTIFENLEPDNSKAGSYNITSSLDINSVNYPSIAYWFKQGSYSTVCCIVGLEDGITKLYQNYGVIPVSGDSLGSFTYSLIKEIKNENGSVLSNTNLGYGGYKSSFNEYILKSDNDLTSNSYLVYTSKISFTSPPIEVSMPTEVNTNDLDVLTRRYGVEMLYEL